MTFWTKIAIAWSAIWIIAVIGMLGEHFYSRWRCHNIGGTFLADECVRLERIEP